MPTAGKRQRLRSGLVAKARRGLSGVEARCYVLEIIYLIYLVSQCERCLFATQNTSSFSSHGFLTHDKSSHYSLEKTELRGFRDKEIMPIETINMTIEPAS